MSTPGVARTPADTTTTAKVTATMTDGAIVDMNPKGSTE